MKTVSKFLAVALALSLISACSMKSMMLNERVSPYGVDDTISKIKENALAIGWVVPGVKNMNKSILKNGGPDIGGPVRIVEMCNAQYAGKILETDEGRYSALFMPCSIAVYTKADGHTYVSSMKAARMGSMMGGIVSEVMQDVDTDQNKILDFLNSK